MLRLAPGGKKMEWEGDRYPSENGTGRLRLGPEGG